MQKKKDTLNEKKVEKKLSFLLGHADNKSKLDLFY